VMLSHKEQIRDKKPFAGQGTSAPVLEKKRLPKQDELSTGRKNQAGVAPNPALTEELQSVNRKWGAELETAESERRGESSRRSPSGGSRKSGGGYRRE